LNSNDIVAKLYQDKKTIGGRLRFVLPIRIGNVVINDGANEETILKVLASD
jgi:3-dehydroquinate synthase